MKRRTFLKILGLALVAPKAAYSAARNFVEDSEIKRVFRNIWFVGGTKGSDFKSGKRPDGAFATLQVAVDSCAEGDTIFVMPGHVEYLTANINKDGVIVSGGRF